MLKKLGLFASAVLLFISSLFLASNPALAETYEVKMGGDNSLLVFDPPSLTIKPGDTVKWINNKVGPHNVVFDNTKISNTLSTELSDEQLAFRPNESWEATFPKDIAPGEYPYYCQPHRGAGMAATIIVQD